MRIDCLAQPFGYKAEGEIDRPKGPHITVTLNIYIYMTFFKYG